MIDAILIAVLALVVSIIGSANPSFWYDEAATISASTRPLPELFELVSSTDSAHTFYYLLMHGWFEIFPHTELWSRIPSSLAVGVAAAGVVTLGRLLSTRSVALSAGVIFAVLPRITSAGIEARPYALATLASVWLTVILIVAARRTSRLMWLLYAVGVVFAVLVNIHLLMLIGVHLCALVMLRLPWVVLRSWALSAAGALVVLIPYLVFMRAQSGQLSWIDPLDHKTFGNVLLTQYFDFSMLFGVLAYVVVAIAAWLYVRRRKVVAFEGQAETAAISVVWMVVPTVGLLVYSIVSQPIYVDRYLSFTAPGAALLLGVSVVTVARKPRLIAALLLAFAIAAVPNWITQRGDYAKFKMDYSQVADTIAAQSSPGDCLLLDDNVTWEPGPIRPLLSARPDAYADLVDVGLGRTGREEGRLWDDNIAPHLIRDKINACSVIWTIAERDPALGSRDVGPNLAPGGPFGTTYAYRVPARLGFHIVERWQFNISQVTKSVR
ncbi:mannosyltransferase [Williamsia limnetica]|uniref:Mannosyltransferase n=1 Tax=Williamsia limnetica TaxID=882452 RepID=A0A318S5R8_WILLI|nr:glycosyltransferase family 39 protein [Williamsia limnetica]PYE19479.1 mannosyltransferase [Williamsia limnetica]